MKAKTYLKKMNDIRKNTTAAVLASPAIVKEKMSKRRSDIDVALLKRARAYDDAPDRENGAITDAYKTRFMAGEVKKRLGKKK